MGDTSLKFGGWRYCRTCERKSQVKATENKKWMGTKKRQIRQKKGLKKKNEKNGLDGSWGDRPRDPSRLALGAALWTIGTSGKALYDCKKTTFDSYRNLDRRKVCTNNKKVYC